MKKKLSLCNLIW